MIDHGLGEHVPRHVPDRQGVALESRRVPCEVLGPTERDSRESRRNDRGVTPRSKSQGRFPRITYTSKGVEIVGAVDAKAYGDVTIRP